MVLLSRTYLILKWGQTAKLLNSVYGSLGIIFWNVTALTSSLHYRVFFCLVAEVEARNTQNQRNTFKSTEAKVCPIYAGKLYNL